MSVWLFGLNGIREKTEGSEMNIETNTKAEKVRAIKAAVNRMELIHAEIDAIADDAFRACIAPGALAIAEAAHAKAGKAIASYHKALAKAAKESGDITVQTGGGGK